MYIRVKQLSNAIPIRNLENANKAKVLEKAVIIPAIDPIVLPRCSLRLKSSSFMFFVRETRILLIYVYTQHESGDTTKPVGYVTHQDSSDAATEEQRLSQRGFSSIIAHPVKLRCLEQQQQQQR